MDLIKFIFSKVYNFTSVIKYYILNNKRNLPITLIYFIIFSWILSLLPKFTLILIIAFLFNNTLSIRYAESITTLCVSIILLWKFIEAIQLPLTIEVDVEPLSKYYPKLEVELKKLAQAHKINKKIKFFLKNSDELNAEAISNLYESAVIINSSIMCLPKDEIIAIVSHEFYHIKNWSTLFINREIWFLYIKFYTGISCINEKGNKNKLTKFLLINSITQIWQMVGYMFLLILLIFSCTYRVLIDEMLADKYSVDSTESKSIANIFRKMAPKEIFDDNDNAFSLIINRTHIPSKFRYTLIDKYHYWKYIKPNWKYNRIIIILKVISIPVSGIVLSEILKVFVPIVFQWALFILSYYWNSFFDFNEQISMLVFILLVASIGAIWNILKLYKSLRRFCSIKHRLKYCSLICLFMFLFFTVLFEIFRGRSFINLYIALFFVVMFVMLEYLHKRYEDDG